MDQIGRMNRDALARPLVDAANRVAGTATREPERDNAVPAAGKRVNALDALIDESAAVAVRSFVRAGLLPGERAAAFGPVFAQIKELAFQIAGKDPLRHLDEAEYDKRLKDAASRLLGHRRLLDRTDRLPLLTFQAVSDIIAASRGDSVRIPQEWLDVIGTRDPSPAGEADDGPAKPGNQAGQVPDNDEGTPIGEELQEPEAFDLVPRLGNPDSADERDRLLQCVLETEPVRLFSDEFGIVGAGLLDGEIVALDPFVAAGTFDDGDEELVDHRFGTFKMLPDRRVPFMFNFLPFEKDTLDEEDVQDAVTLVLIVLKIVLVVMAQNDEAARRNVPLPSGSVPRDALRLLEQLQSDPEVFNKSTESVYGMISRFINDVLGITNELFTRYVMTGDYVYEKTRKVLRMGVILRAIRSAQSGLRGGRTVSCRYTLTRESLTPGVKPFVLGTHEQFGIGTSSDDIHVFEKGENSRGDYRLDPAMSLKVAG